MQKNSIENFISDPDFEWFAESLKKKNSISALKRSLSKINELLKNRFTQNNDDIILINYVVALLSDKFEAVLVYCQKCEPIRNKAAATQQKQRLVSA